MRALTGGVSSAVGGVTYRISEATSPSIATAQAITGQATTSAMLWGVRHSRDHSAATRWRSAPIAKEITLRAAAGVQRRAKPPERGGRAERQEQQGGFPRAKLRTRQRGRIRWCLVIHPGEEGEQLAEGQKGRWLMRRKSRQRGRREMS